MPQPQFRETQTSVTHRVSTLPAAEGDRMEPVLIRRPDAPEHYMVVSQPRQSYSAWSGPDRLATSSTALTVDEMGKRRYPLVVYFNRDALAVQLEPTGKRTRCPLKGVASYFDVVLPDGTRLSNAAWSYEELLDFDTRLSWLKDRVAFDASFVQIDESGTGTSRHARPC